MSLLNETAVALFFESLARVTGERARQQAATNIPTDNNESAFFIKNPPPPNLTSTSGQRQQLLEPVLPLATQSDRSQLQIRTDWMPRRAILYATRRSRQNFLA